jgi:chromosome segregation ATPase
VIKSKGIIKSHADFINQKREIFWLKMKSSIKSGEISKISKQLDDQKTALEKAASTLEEDKEKFVCFVTAHEERSAAASKALQELTTQKNEKLQVLQTIEQQIGKLDSEIADLKSAIKHANNLKTFLDSVKKNDENFTEPAELLAHFSALEERNLFLIQNIQESQTSLEACSAEFKASQDAFEEKISRLKAANEAIKKEIQSTGLSNHTLSGNIKVEKNSVAVFAQQLTEGISRFSEFVTDSRNPTDLLTQVEKKFTSLLQEITAYETVNPEFVRKLEKTKEMERREKLRFEKLEEQKSKNEARLKLSMVRAQAPIFQKTGKPVMFRSVLKKKENVKISDNREEQLMREEISNFGVHVAKDIVKLK